MKVSKKIVTTVSTLSLLVIAPLMLSAGAASAQPKGTDASYVGAGMSFGATSGGNANDAATYGGNIQGRVAIPNAPVSVRGSVLFTDKNSTVIPTLTYDAPIARNTNLYAGVGYSFVQNQGATATPLGNRDSVVLTTGVESEVAKNVMVYSDAKYGINAYQNSSANALSFQLGVGYRF
ncbi:MAG: outer membrane beta-barrel protein [Leptolyngbyaceae cyanobacterium bins.59]|nr:outer membrane beta-barrel protein [Leptolyngbyaceae cyanobacterium bins.59]